MASPASRTRLGSGRRWRKLPHDRGRETRERRPRTAAVARRRRAGSRGDFPSKLGPARRARLSDAERALYFWILRSFASQGRPSSAETREAAVRLGVDVPHAFETLAREDLIHLDGDGEIAVAYPFSGRPTAHQARFPSGHETYAMCALDALGIAPMFDEPTEVVSRDPVSGAEVRAQLSPEGEGTRRPQSALVVAGVLDRHADCCSGCCPVLNFFASAENAERWLEEQLQVRGHTASRVRRRPRRTMTPRPIDREAVRPLVADRGQLVDVLPPAEYEQEHLPGAINVPLKHLDLETTRQLERERPVIVYCHDYQ